MKNIKKLFHSRYEAANHVLAAVIGLGFGIIGACSHNKIEGLIGQLLFSSAIGLFMGLYMALSAANSEDEKPRVFILLGGFYAVRIIVFCFLTMFLASAMR